MDCGVSFEGVTGAEVTGHRKPFVPRRAGFLDMWNKFIVNTCTLTSKAFRGPIVIKITLDP
jgi:hypothetical protein